MVVPLKSWFTVFDAIGATAIARIPALGAALPEHANSLILEIIAETAPSWTLDIQGRTDPGGTYTALDYVQTWQAGAAALSNAQLSITDTIRRFYMIPNCPTFLQLTATRTAGSLTIRGSYTSEVYSQWLLTTARGSIYVEGPVASDAVEAGNPVQIAGSVDDTSPAAAGEGDARRIRSTPEGNVIAELYRDNTSATQLEDAAHASGDGGVMALGVRDDSPAALLSGTDGDYEPLHVGPVGGLVVGGPIAHDEVLGGNPLLLGGDARAATSLVTAVAAGDVVRLAASTRGLLYTSIASDSENGAALVQLMDADGRSAANVALVTDSRLMLFTGTTWQRMRGVTRTAYLASAARTGDTNGANRTNYNFQGLAVLINVSAVGAPAGSITLNVQIQDETTSNYITIATGAIALATTGQRAYLVYPTAENNEGWTEHFNTVLGAATYRVRLDHANETDSITYSVDLIELPF